jgi:hypothetical protein
VYDITRFAGIPTAVALIAIVVTSGPGSESSAINYISGELDGKEENWKADKVSKIWETAIKKYASNIMTEISFMIAGPSGPIVSPTNFKGKIIIS